MKSSRIARSLFTLATIATALYSPQSHATQIIHSNVKAAGSKDGTVNFDIVLGFSHDGPDDTAEIFLDFGDGERVDLVRGFNLRGEALDDPTLQGRQTTLKLTDFDGSPYRHKHARFSHTYADPEGSYEIKVVAEHRDARVINADPTRAFSAPMTVDLTHNLGDELAFDMAVMPVEVGQVHTFDLARLWPHQSLERNCRLRALDESGLTAQAPVKITPDCKIEIDARNGQLGERYAVQYEVRDVNGGGRVVEQQILMVDSLKDICETQSEVLVGVDEEQKVLGVESFLLAPIVNRHLVVGWIPAYQVGGTSQDPTPKPYDVHILTYGDRQPKGRYMLGTMVGTAERIDGQTSSVCPMIYEVGCEDRSDGRVDEDNDLICFENDNCPDIANPDQLDDDQDGIGNACDLDADNDGVLDDVDNCLNTDNADQSDFDQDGQGDACDADIDNDGVPNEQDACGGSTGSNTLMVGQGCTLRDACPCLDGFFGQWIYHRCVVNNTVTMAFSGEISWSTYFGLYRKSRYSCI